MTKLLADLKKVDLNTYSVFEKQDHSTNDKKTLMRSEIPTIDIRSLLIQQHSQHVFFMFEYLFINY